LFRTECCNSGYNAPLWNMDNLTKRQRSYCMSRIRSKDSQPELIVRKIIHSLGYRFRLHRRDLPGCPDIVLPRHMKIIFVHGCFWHKHNCRHGRVMPKTNKKYWQEKRKGNVERFKKNMTKLKRLGWKVLVIWECQTKKPEKIINKLSEFLRSY